MIDYDLLRRSFEEVDAESSYFWDNDELIIDARDSQVSDRELELLRGLTNITYANFANTSITNAGIMILRPNHRLGYLDLFNTSFCRRYWAWPSALAAANSSSSPSTNSKLAPMDFTVF